MSRGFSISVLVSDPSGLSVETLRSDALSSNRLTALESGEFVGAVVDAAKALIGSMPQGPVWVNLSGVDRSTEPGEETSLFVHVRAATPAAAAAPASSVSVGSPFPNPATFAPEPVPAAEPPLESTPAVEQVSPLPEGA